MMITYFLLIIFFLNAAAKYILALLTVPQASNTWPCIYTSSKKKIIITKDNVTVPLGKHFSIQRSSSMLLSEDSDLAPISI